MHSVLAEHAQRADGATRPDPTPQGVPGDARPDPYSGQSRLGGALSHLHRESAPAAWEAALLDVRAEAEAASEACHPEGQDEEGEPPEAACPACFERWDDWWWDRALVLHRLGVCRELERAAADSRGFEALMASLQVGADPLPPSPRPSGVRPPRPALPWPGAPQRRPALQQAGTRACQGAPGC